MAGYHRFWGCHPWWNHLGNRENIWMGKIPRYIAIPNREFDLHYSNIGIHYPEHSAHSNTQYFRQVQWQVGHKHKIV